MVKSKIDIARLSAEQWLIRPATRQAIVRRHRDEVPVSKSESASRRRLFVDMGIISQHDAGTGIQRVARALALALSAVEADGWDVRFVAANRRQEYHEIGWPNPAGDTAHSPLSGQPGDVFMGLDFCLDSVRRYRRQLRRFRKDGGRLWFVVYDLLPIDQPDWFSPPSVVRYRSWLDTMASVADGFFCISAQTKEDLRRVLANRYDLVNGFETVILPMSHDIHKSRKIGLQLAKTDPHPALSGAQPFALMVGTVEPRKGHADIIDAFDRLWKAGSGDRLVIVGRMGWHVDALRKRILAHPQYGKKLVWLDDANDEELDFAYRSCTGVIVGSHGEGFGLPLIEALGYGKPVFARDLEVFHQHTGRGVTFFPRFADSAALSRDLTSWLVQAAAGQIQVTPPVTDWATSARTVLDALG